MMNFLIGFFNYRIRHQSRAFGVLAMVSLLNLACVSDQSSVKDNFRVLPLQQGYSLKTLPSQTPPLIIFDDGALDSEEHQLLINKLQETVCK